MQKGLNRVLSPPSIAGTKRWMCSSERTSISVTDLTMSVTKIFGKRKVKLKVKWVKGINQYHDNLIIHCAECINRRQMRVRKLNYSKINGNRKIGRKETQALAEFTSSLQGYTSCCFIKSRSLKYKPWRLSRLRLASRHRSYQTIEVSQTGATMRQI